MPSLVSVGVSFFLFQFFALHGAYEPHFSRETLRADTVQPPMDHSVTDEFRMVLLVYGIVYQIITVTIYSSPPQIGITGFYFGLVSLCLFFFLHTLCTEFFSCCLFVLKEGNSVVQKIA